MPKKQKEMDPFRSTKKEKGWVAGRVQLPCTDLDEAEDSNTCDSSTHGSGVSDIADQSASSIGATGRSSLRSSGNSALGGRRRVVLRGLRGAGGRLAKGSGRRSALSRSGGLARSRERVRDGLVGGRGSDAGGSGGGNSGRGRERNLAAGFVDDGALVHGVDHGAYRRLEVVYRRKLAALPSMVVLPSCSGGRLSVD